MIHIKSVVMKVEPLVAAHSHHFSFSHFPRFKLNFSQQAVPVVATFNYMETEIGNIY